MSVTIGIVGLGYWGPNLLRNLVATSGWNVTRACDIAPDRLARAQAQYPSIACTASVSDLLDDPALSVVAIATPASTHYELAKAALERGKHVIVEKPMTATVSEADDLIALARRQQRHLLVDHTFVYSGAVRKIRDMVARGELGDLYYFDSTRINLGLIQRDMNVLWDLAIHDLSILAELRDLTTVESIYAQGSRHYGRQEEIGHLHLSFAGGFEAHIHVSWLSPVKLRQSIIGGTRKMVVFDDLEPSEKIRVYDTGIQGSRLGEAPQADPFFPVYRTGDVVMPKLDSTEALRVAAEHFLRVVRGEERPRISPEQGRLMLQVLERANQSIALKQPVSF